MWLMSKQTHLYLGHSLFKAQKQYIQRKRTFSLEATFVALQMATYQQAKKWCMLR